MGGYTTNSYAQPDFYKMFRDGYTRVAVDPTDVGPSFKKEMSAGGWAGAIGIGTSIGQGVGSAIGGYITAKAAATSLYAQGAISEDNARLAQFGVEQAFQAGEAQMAQIGFKQAETKARQRAAYAASGVAIGVGSTAEVMASTDLQAEVDKATARRNALAQAWGYRRQRMMMFAQAEGNRIMANAATSAGRVNMYAGLASTALSAWAGFNGGGK